MAQQKVQDEILRAMTPHQKLQAAMNLYYSARQLQAAMNLYYSARQLKAAWIRQQHKDWSEKQVEEAVREIFVNARS